MLNKIVSKLKAIRTNFLNKQEVRKIVDGLIRSSATKRIFLFQTPTHSNIGDHAIAEAQLEFFQTYFPNFEVIEINQSLMQPFIKSYKQLVREKDLLTLIGGGNFGNEYMREEGLRRLVVENFPNNKIIVFPQTIHYSKDEAGQRELKITQEIFSKHQNLTLTAREQVSYELMNKYFPDNQVILTPDIVLFTSKVKESDRTYGLEVIRQDQESILSENDKAAVSNLLRSHFKEVIASDMHVEGFRPVRSIEDRKQVLENKYSQFRGAEIAITDRLHGMVLATITGTRCVVFSNYNQKVLGTYDWIKHLEYIKFVKSIDEAKIAFEELVNLKDYAVYDNNDMKDKFIPLKEALDA